MQVKIFSLLVVVLLTFTSVYADVCRTQIGVAWCKSIKNSPNYGCRNRAGESFNGYYCRSATSDGRIKIQGGNCRECPQKNCSIVTSKYWGTLNYYHKHNGYYLTTKGWCYDG